MAKLGFFFLAPVWDAVMSVSEMRTLTEHTEWSIAQAIIEVNKPGAVQMEEVIIEYDDEHSAYHDYFYYKGISGDSEDEVKATYIYQLSKMLRYSAFMVIYGLFEFHMAKCYELMIKASGHVETKADTQKAFLQRVHKILNQVINCAQGNDIEDVDHLRHIRNKIAHHNGIVIEYGQNPTSNRAVIRAILRAIQDGVLCMNSFNEIVLNREFLPYAVNQIERYLKEMRVSMQAYYQSNQAERSANVPE
ncbi:TPA: hypothetical protein RY435_004026 [Escherichia albertii]|uniref:hypothetical protein n=1 Tax=Escherichia albertii TaxID=208962 RepID=UPI0007434371|nr:hypothetical protein [Escherichia albertii]HEB1530391.1 hypothetical protein [Escherichia albertii]HEB1544474.1 hypothetical protein [Escherichia albertii]